MNFSQLAILTFCLAIGATIFILIQARFDIRKNLTIEEKEFSFKRLVYIGNYMKWLIGAVVIYLLIVLVNDKFRNKELEAQQMNQYETVLHDVLTKDSVVRRNTVEFYSMMEPNSNYKQNWKDYLKWLDTLEAHKQRANLIYRDSSKTMAARNAAAKTITSINQRLQPVVSDYDKTLNRIDITFYKPNTLITHLISFHIEDKGTPIYSTSWEANFFITNAYRNTVTTNLALDGSASLIRKDQLKSYDLHFETHGPHEAFEIDCDIKFFYSDGTSNTLSHLVTNIPKDFSYGDWFDLRQKNLK